MQEQPILTDVTKHWVNRLHINPYHGELLDHLVTLVHDILDCCVKNKMELFPVKPGLTEFLYQSLCMCYHLYINFIVLYVFSHHCFINQMTNGWDVHSIQSVNNRLEIPYPSTHYWEVIWYLCLTQQILMTMVFLLFCS